MKYYYEIAKRRIIFDSEYPLQINRDSAFFQKDYQKDIADIYCCIRQKNSLDKPEGRLIQVKKEQKIYCENRKITQKILNREDGSPLFQTIFFTDQKQIRLYARRDAYPYTARMEHIWAAMNLPYQLLKCERLTIHCAAIAVQGSVILFAGPSGIGKSTQAELWHRWRGAQLLNGDKTILAAEGEMIYAYGAPFCGTSGICSDFKIRVRTIVILGQAKENSIKKITDIRALTAVLENCFGHREIPGCIDMMLKILEKILDKVDVYRMNCTPDLRAVQILEKELMEER